MASTGPAGGLVRGNRARAMAPATARTASVRICVLRSPVIVARESHLLWHSRGGPPGGLELRERDRLPLKRSRLDAFDLARRDHIQRRRQAAKYRQHGCERDVIEEHGDGVHDETVVQTHRAIADPLQPWISPRPFVYVVGLLQREAHDRHIADQAGNAHFTRSEEHTSELQSHSFISY